MSMAFEIGDRVRLVNLPDEKKSLEDENYVIVGIGYIKDAYFLAIEGREAEGAELWQGEYLALSAPSGHLPQSGRQGTGALSQSWDISQGPAVYEELGDVDSETVLYADGAPFEIHRTVTKKTLRRRKSVAELLREVEEQQEQIIREFKDEQRARDGGKEPDAFDAF